MGYHLSYFDDTYGSGAVADEPLAAAHRIFYVFDGEAVIEGRTVETGGAIYASGAADIRGGSQGARVFRWDLSAFPPAAGEDAPSIPRMTQPIWSLETEPGSRWLFRLDRIDNAPGIVADVHTSAPCSRELSTCASRRRTAPLRGRAIRGGSPVSRPSSRRPVRSRHRRFSGACRCRRNSPVGRTRPDGCGRNEWSGRGWQLYVDEIVTL
ncbi:MAG TPA: hypothetical protein VII91_11540 [Bauldia sp.]